MRPVSLGFVYGLVLAVFSFWSAGFGHGTYLPLALFSAPLPFGGVIVALFGMPLMWALVGFLVSESEGIPALMVFLLSMIVHYASALFLLSTDAFGDWDHISRQMKMGSDAAITITGLLFYVIGQVILWTVFARINARARRNQKTSIHPVP